jgi:flagellin-specific chaperone FliS
VLFCVYFNTQNQKYSNISIENVFEILLELQHYGDLSNGNPLEHLTWLYKNMSPNITVGNLKAS